MFDLCKLLGVEEGEIFKLNGTEYKIEDNKFKHKQLESGEFCAVGYSLNLLAEAEFERMPFVPKKGQRYWIPTGEVGKEIYSKEVTFDGDLADFNALDLDICYKTKEQSDAEGIPKMQALRDKWKKKLGW